MPISVRFDIALFGGFRVVETPYIDVVAALVSIYVLLCQITFQW